MAGIKFFGEIDLSRKNTPVSQYPAWYFDQPLDRLQEDISALHRQIERGDAPQDKMPEIKARLGQLEERYEKIRESIPKLSELDKDKISKARKAMAAHIRDGYFSRSQMDKGTVDAFKEVERMRTPKVEVKPEFAEFLGPCNVKVQDGKVSRDGLVKAWKILGKALNRNGGEEDTNAEVLRRD